MRKGVVLGVLLALALAGGWMIMGAGAPPTTDASRTVARAEVTEVDREARQVRGEEPQSEAPAAVARTAGPGKRGASKQERDAMRRRILAAMQAREETSPHDGGAGEDRGDARGKAGEPEPPAPRKRPDDEGPAPGNLVDRTGNHGHLAKVMNEDLMPLVDECYALVRETQPELEGMLVLDVEMIGDADIGGVVESTALGKGSELVDPALVECVQESLLSTTLPPPPEGGKDAIQLQMRLEPDAG